MAILEDKTDLDTETETENDSDKSLEYYMANPSEMPEDVDLINEIPMEDGAEKEDEKEEVQDSDDKEKTDDNAETEGEVDESTRPDILAKNGKDVLPFGVLEGTRNDLNDTRNELSQANSKIEELNKIVDGYKGEADKAAAAEKDLHDGEDAPLTETGELDIEKLRELYDDDVVDVMIGLHNKTLVTMQKYDDLSKKVESVIGQNEHDEEETERASVQDAIDNTPFIAEIQAKGGDDWDTAIAIDKSLRLNPLWKDKSYEDRFKEIARQMGDKPVTTEGDLDDKVDKALKNAESNRPTSISDLEGGDFVDSEGIQSGANLSVTQIEGRLEDMSSEQLESWLATG